MEEENQKTTSDFKETTPILEPEVKDVPKVETKKEEPKQTPKMEKQKKKKKVGLIISILLILLAVIGGCVGGAIYALQFSKTEVDLSKYISIEFDGYEGYASFDEDDLAIDQKGLKKVLDDKKLAEKLEKKLLDKVEFKNSENVKNGDVIEVKFKVSEDWLKENKIKLTSDTIKLTVKDLDEPNSVDLFEDLEFTYSGISPDLTITIKNNSSDDFIKNKVSFSMEKDKDKDAYSSSYSLYDIANGDKIKVTATYSQSDLEAAGYATAEDEYTFTVEGQAEYIDSSDDITSDIKSTLEEKLLAKAKSIANNSNYDLTSAYHEDFSDISHYDYNLSHTDPELQKMYIAINNNMDDISWSDYRNIVYGIYKVVFTDSTTSKTYDLYIAVKVEELVATEDGLYTDKTYYYDEFYNGSYNAPDGNDYHRSSDEVYNAIKDKLGSDNYTITELN